MKQACQTTMVSEVTRFQERVRTSLRGELLDATARLLPEQGFAGLRMADVAAAIGVSRQTVYNEFGNKEALVSAVALRTEASFFDEADRRMRAAEHLLDGIEDSLRWTISHARKDPLVASILGAGAAVDLLPFLTAAKGEPLLHSGAEITIAVLADRAPRMPEKTAIMLAEQTFRLLLSHIVQPAGSPSAAARAITEFISPHLQD